MLMMWRYKLLQTTSMLSLLCGAYLGGVGVSQAQVVANGVPVTVPGNTTINTGTTAGTPGYGIRALNGGSVTAESDVQVTTGGSNARGVDIASGGSIEADSIAINTTGMTAHGAFISGAGSTATFNGGNISTTNSGAYGMIVRSGGLITATDLAVSAAGTTLAGIEAGDVGSTVSLFGGTVSTSGNSSGGIGAFALSAFGGATIQGTSVGVSTSGSTNAVRSEGTGTNVILNDSTIGTTANSASGADALLGGTLVLNNTTITTSGNASSGVRVFDAGSVAVIQGGSVTTSGTSSFGVGFSSSTGTLTDSTIVTIGASSNGVIVGGATGQAILNGGSVSTAGAGSRGLNVLSGGNVQGANLVVSTQGANAFGAAATGVGTVIDLTDGSVTTRGADAHGLSVSNGGSISAQGTAIGTSGAGAAGIYATRTTVNTVSTVTLQDADLTSSLGETIRSEGGLLAVSFDNVRAANNGTLVTATDGGSGAQSAVDFSAANSALLGDLVASSFNILNVGLTNSSLTGSAFNATNVSLDAASAWTLSGSSTISDTLTNAGQIAFAGPQNGGFKTLTTGNYGGVAGLLTLNTTLGGDGSPTDRLIVAGDTFGTTSINVLNSGGTGALTNEGIEIIRVGGNSDGVFTLNGNALYQQQSVVVAGAYSYGLYKGNTSGTDLSDWYLRSVMIAPGTPLLTPAAQTYQAYPSAILGLNGLPTLQQRVGNRFWWPVSSDLSGATPEANAGLEQAPMTETSGLWVRLEAEHAEIDFAGATLPGEYRQSLVKLHTGFDALLSDTENGKLIGGLSLQYVTGTTHIFADRAAGWGDGSIATNGYGIGGTISWYDRSGFYVDVQAQATWYDSDLTSGSSATTFTDGNLGFGYAFSGEVGQRFVLDENWSVTPQAQLVYSQAKLDRFVDTYGAVVDANDAQSLRGRFGMSLDYEALLDGPHGDPGRTHLYAIANLYNEFLDPSRVSADALTLTGNDNSLWGGIGVGGSYNWGDDKYSLYGEGSVATSVADFGNSYAFQGQVGIRVRW